jgi:hypothetical protein
MPDIYINDEYGEISFPDSMSDDEIKLAIHGILKKKPTAQAAPAPQPPREAYDYDIPSFEPTTFQDTTRVAERPVMPSRPTKPQLPVETIKEDEAVPGAARFDVTRVTPQYKPERSVLHDDIALAKRHAKNIAAGGAGTLGGMFGAADWIVDSDVTKDLVQKAEGWQKELSPPDPNLSDAIVQGFGSSAIFFVPGIGIAKGAGVMASVAPKVASWMGAGVATALESMTEAGATYNEVLNKTGDKDRASSAATKTLLLNLPLDAVTNKLGVFGDKGGNLRKMVMSSLTEAGQEAGQEVISAVSAGRDIDPRAVGQAGIVGGVVGGTTGGLVGGRKASVDELIAQQLQEELRQEKPAGPEQQLGRGGAAAQQVAPPSPEVQQPVTPQTEEIVRKSSIVKELSEKLEVPIRTGNFRQRIGPRLKRLGIFKTRPKVIRLGKAQDIDTLAHEAGHLIHREVYSPDKSRLHDNDFAQWTNELRPLAYPAAKKNVKRLEGFAEFVRLYVTDPDVAQKKAPNFYNDFEARLGQDNPAMLDTMLKARDRYDLWRRMPATAKVMSQISFDESVRNRPTADDLYTQFVDQLHPLEMAVNQITQGRHLQFTDNPYILARLFAGWTGKADTFLQHSPFDFNNYGFFGKSFKDIMKPIGNRTQEFSAYIRSFRDVELNKRNIETGVDTKTAKKTISEQASPEFEQARKELGEYQDALLKYMLDGGILSEEKYNDFKNMNRYYVPFFRWAETKKSGGRQRGFANLFSPIKRIKGSGLEIIDPLESIVKNTYTLIEMVERNEVGRALAKLSEVEGAGKFVEKIPTPMMPTSVEVGEVLKKSQLGKMLKAELGPEALSQFDQELVEIFRPSQFTPQENVIAVWQDGKRSFYEVAPDVYQTMLSLGKEGTNMVTKILSQPARWLRAGATLSPGFIGRNPIRDQWSAYLYSNYGYLPGIDFTRGLFHMLKKDDQYWNWKVGGGEHSMLVSLDRVNLQKNLGDLVAKNPGIRGTIKSPIEALRILSEHMETGTRLGEFAKAAKAEGVTKEGILKSAFSAREVTLDFARIGSSMKAMNQVVAFSNAGIQGIDKFAREAKNNPRRLWPRVVAGITAPSIMLYAMNKDDEEIQELPQWERDLFWIIRLTPNQLIRVPKNFEVGVAFGSVPERILDWHRTNDPKGFNKSMDSIAEGLLPETIPTALVPLGENFANKSKFTGRPIVPRGKEDLEPYLQSKDYTSEAAKMIGKALNYSPAKIDNVIFGYTGGLGRLTVDSIDGLLEAFGIVDLPPQPERTLSDIPGLKAFVPRFPSGSTESIESFYEDYNKAKKVRKSLKELLSRGDKEEAEAYLKKNKEFINKARWGQLRSIHKNLSGQRKRIQVIYKDRKMSPKEKRQKLNIIYIEMTNTAREYLGKKPLLSLQVRR